VILDIVEPADIARTRVGHLDPTLTQQFVKADVTVPGEVAVVLDAVVRELGGIDVLVVGAGVAIPAAPVRDVTDADLERIIGVNVRGVVWTLKAALAPMTAAGGGIIVVISSQTGKQAWDGWGVYSGSKAFAISLVQAIALEHASDGIRINAVCPGTMDSDMMRTAFAARAASSGRSLEDEIHAYAEKIPRGRVGNAGDVGAAVAWLASDQSDFVTGTALNLTGGEMLFF
jgi:NAD(P)-dependent dehydrogenase (short-subunit alcohol dehydrogenase family)